MRRLNFSSSSIVVMTRTEKPDNSQVDCFRATGNSVHFRRRIEPFTSSLVMPDQERLLLRNQKTKREGLSCKHPRKNSFSYKFVLFALVRSFLNSCVFLIFFLFLFFTIFLKFSWWKPFPWIREIWFWLVKN